MIESVLAEVLVETEIQICKWGVQNHPGPEYLAILVEEVGEVAKAIQESRLGKMSPDEIRGELIQVAAVAASMIQAYDRGFCR